MAKLTLADILAGYASTSTYNNNNALIEAALENTLSRDGTSPNAMSADLDMNNNRVINLKDPESDYDVATKTYVDNLISAIASSNTPDPQSFNGGSATYTLSTAVDESDILVFVNGAVQIAGDAYQITGGTTLDFGSATPSGTGNINVVYLTDNNFSTVTPDNSVSTVKIVDEAVTTAKLGADAVTGAKLADDSVDSEHYVDGSIDTQHIADSQITTAKIANDAVTLDKIADANIITEAEGISSNDNDTTLPTSAAVKDYVDTQVATGLTVYSGTQVYSGAMPTSYTDLDLSGTIGTNRALVTLSVEPDVNTEVAFRINGETKTVAGTTAGGGTNFGAGFSAAAVNNGAIVYLQILTDANGIVEWISDFAGTTSTVTLLTYTLL